MAPTTYIINASQPANDKIFDVSAFEKFLHDRIKVEGRVGNLGESVQISQVGDGKIEVITHIPFSGRYLKYLTKKFLKKQQLRDWLRVVSASKVVYELRFYNIVQDEVEEDDEWMGHSSFDEGFEEREDVTCDWMEKFDSTNL
ncbi:60S ribosomal protein L22 [Trichophyton violaceum]|uniref:60S ribosomal protein L22 n=1 Tax=Trichophyton violaceum TaxID=34388 RepID=A0A178FSX5_TRIVO|nr:60S ribosomal protein L22 [Trichophyton violaceum]